MFLDIAVTFKYVNCINYVHTYIHKSDCSCISLISAILARFLQFSVICINYFYITNYIINQRILKFLSNIKFKYLTSFSFL